MSVRISTARPSALLATLKRAIDAKQITTWSYDADGDFTHTPEQWKNRAWLRPSIRSGELLFTTISPKSGPITWEVYGVYMGRFAEMAIVHVHDSINNIQASPSPADGDITS
jgi:hypothetical protein